MTARDGATPDLRAEPALAARLLDALPQTQCRRCGYADCRDYAEAIAAGIADIDRCPPGGSAGIAKLAIITGRPVVPLDTACGTEGPRGLALIDEPACIGCALCLPACPVDAIVGRSKRTHTVIASVCTGCELCVAVCPVDCFRIVSASGTSTGWDAWSATLARAARDRYDAHAARVGRNAAPSHQTEPGAG